MIWNWLRRLIPGSAPSGLDSARAAFGSEGLWFPVIPERLAGRLAERRRWVFSSAPISNAPYGINAYVDAFERGAVSDYALLAHDGHGVNSHALHYYLVLGDAGLFVQVPWGGVYMDSQACADNIRVCFQLMDRIAAVLEGRSRGRPAGRLTVVASDLYGSYWYLDWLEMGRAEAGGAGAQQVLGEVLAWLLGVPGGDDEKHMPSIVSMSSGFDRLNPSQ